MNHTDLPTDDLIEVYFETDHAIHGGDGTARRLSKMSDMLAELEARGVCPRDLRAPGWYTEATDSRRGMC